MALSNPGLDCGTGKPDYAGSYDAATGGSDVGDGLTITSGTPHNSTVWPRPSSRARATRRVAAAASCTPTPTLL